MPIRQVTQRQGWFAEKMLPDDVDYTAEAPWQAVVQLDGYVAVIGSIWFQSKEDCERWLREEVIGLGMWKDNNV